MAAQRLAPFRQSPQETTIWHMCAISHYPVNAWFVVTGTVGCLVTDSGLLPEIVFMDIGLVYQVYMFKVILSCQQGHATQHYCCCRALLDIVKMCFGEAHSWGLAFSEGRRVSSKAVNYVSVNFDPSAPSRVNRVFQLISKLFRTVRTTQQV